MDILPDPGLLPDTWRIDETPDGWTLRWRPPVTSGIYGLPCTRHFFPTWLYSWRGLAAAYLGVMIVSVVAGRTLGREGNLSARSLGGGAAMQIVLTALHFYALHEKDLNSQRYVIVHGCSVRVPTGSFSVTCLETLRLCSKGARPGRALLKFRGSVVAEADFVDFPGLSQPVAEQLLEAVKARLAFGRLT
ncbi:MAG: hypothetical protein ACKO9B_10245 [Planctomycetota bacterium]